MKQVPLCPPWKGIEVVLSLATQLFTNPSPVQIIPGRNIQTELDRARWVLCQPFQRMPISFVDVLGPTVESLLTREELLKQTMKNNVWKHFTPLGQAPKNGDGSFCDPTHPQMTQLKSQTTSLIAWAFYWPLLSNWAPFNPLNSSCPLPAFAYTLPSFWNDFPCLNWVSLLLVLY